MGTSTGALPAREGNTRLFVAALLATAVGCSEPTVPTRTLVPETASLAAGGNQRVKVKTFQLSANTLRIDGPIVPGEASIGNSGTAIPSGVSIQGVIQQGTITRQAVLEPIVCNGSPGDVGKLPTGTCAVSFNVQASNSGVGDGILEPGSATFVLRVIQTIDGAVTELASKSVLVNLVGSPTLGAPGVASTTWALEGPSTSYTILLKNPASTMQNVFLRSTVVQGPARRSAGADLPVSCGGGPGVFPPGVCTMTVPASASNSATGVGLLLAGPALIEVQLNQSAGGSITTFDTESAAIELVLSTPRIADVVLEAETVVIGGASVNYFAQLQNPGFPVSDVTLQGELQQDQAGGKVVKGAGGTLVQCGGALGLLPTGTCNLLFTVTALGDAIGGAFVPGPAKFVLTLFSASLGQVPVEYDQRIIDVTLVSGAPSIVSITPASNTVVINGPVTTTSVVLANPGPPLSTVLLQGWIRQGTARRAAGGNVLSCGSPFGALPNGGCTQPSVISADNIASSGTGTLVPGAATFELELKHVNGGVETILDVESIPITLVSGTPSIVSITPASEFVVLDQVGAVNSITINITNPGLPLSTVSTQGYIRQGTALRAAGGANVTCGVSPPLSGNLPNGECIEQRTISAFNANGGTGTLVPGPATFELELIRFDGATSTILDTESIPITLVAGGPTIVSVSLETSTLVIGGARTEFTATIFNPGATLSGVSVQGWIDQGSSTQPSGGVSVSCPGTGELTQGSCVVRFTMGAQNQFTPFLVAGPATFRLELRQNPAVLDTKLIPITLINP